VQCSSAIYAASDCFGSQCQAVCGTPSTIHHLCTPGESCLSAAVFRIRTFRYRAHMFITSYSDKSDGCAIASLSMARLYLNWQYFCVAFLCEYVAVVTCCIPYRQHRYTMNEQWTMLPILQTRSPIDHTFRGQMAIFLSVHCSVVNVCRQSCFQIFIISFPIL